MANKKGFVAELLAIIVIGFFALVFFALWIYANGLINTNLLAIPSDDSITNISDAVKNTFSYVNTGLDQLKMIGTIIIIAYILSTLIMAYFVKNHPALFIVYFLITIVLTVFSAYVANAYNDLLTNEVIGSTLSDFGVGGYIMSRLYIWIGVIGFLGIIIMLAGIIKDREWGG